MTPFVVRAIEPKDIKQVLEVEKDAFPTLWPPTPFKREIQNKRAIYLVAVRPEPPISSDDGGISGAPASASGSSITSPTALANGRWRKWAGGLKSLLPSFGRHSNGDFVLGYLGLWHVVEDSHIVSVGVRSPYRRLGVGELLVIRAIESSFEWGVRSITLEVRVSNLGAQTLYEKYGFKKVGIRKRYYLDNHEDALIMTTDPIGTEKYRQEFERLKELHAMKLLGDAPLGPPNAGPPAPPHDPYSTEETS